MARRFFLAAFLLFGAAIAARAVPPDKTIILKNGEELFVPAGQGSWQAISEDPRVVQADGAPGGEIHLQARGRGRALVLVENRKVERVSIWLVLVDEQPAQKPDIDKLPCPCSRPDPEEPPLCLVNGETCLEDMRKALEGGGVTTADLWVRYDMKGMRALLARMERRLRQEGFTRVEPLFAGANLRLQGRVENERQRARLIFEVYRLMVGRLVLEDRLRLDHNPATSAPGATE